MKSKSIVLSLIAIASQFALAGTYSVPVPDGLLSASKWETDATAYVSGSDITVSYLLPEGLVGKGVDPFVFRGSPSGQSFFSVSGDGVFGTCMLSDAKPLTCMLKYPGLRINEESRNEALKSHFSGQALLDRMQVATLFGNDPAGLLTVKLP